MTSFRPQKRINRDAMVRDDVISHLPEEIKDKILTKLPIKDAVRTSILSTKWRFTWASIPEIVVKDDDLVPNRRKVLAKTHFEKNVDVLLLNHNGPILKFDLSTKYHIPEAFDRWILNLPRNGITELTFMLNSGSLPKYRIHSSFFRCDALQHAELCGCLIELPRGFEGLKLLRYLELDTCTISTANLERLISSSPKLVKLILKDFQTEDDLRIFSIGLTSLTVGGDFSDLQIDAPNLVTLIIAYCKNSPPGVRRIKKFCQSLCGLSNLQGCGLFLQYLTDRSPTELLSSCLAKLRFVFLMLYLADQKECGFTFALLQNATNLQKFFLSVRRSEKYHQSNPLG